jgi:DNA-directed RNA polymerase specialized sigma24 family protein
VSKADFADIFREHKILCTGLPGDDRVGERGEDVAQDYFAALLHAPERFDAGRDTLQAFLVGVARNLILKRWRVERRLGFARR